MIIGLSGKMGVGKTSVAKLLTEFLPGYKRMSFGDLVKERTALVFDFPVEWCYSEEGKSAVVPVRPRQDPYTGKLLTTVADSMTVRELLQFYGTDICRGYDPDFWVKALGAEIRENDNVVIDDIRFTNECALVRARNGVVLRLNPWDGWREGPHGKHASETALDDFSDFDFVVDQHGMSVRVSALVVMDYVLSETYQRIRAELSTRYGVEVAQ